MKLNCRFIKSLRENSLGKNGKGLTIEELSFMTNINPRTICLMESDENFNPGIKTVSKVATYFKSSLDNFLIC